jgi:hypothetical protein
MARKKTPKRAPSFTIWANDDDELRIRTAVAAAQERLGFPVSLSAWCLKQIMRAVEEDEKTRR